MRGRIDRQGEIFHRFDLESLVPADHPLRPIKRRADKVLADMSPRFSGAYGRTGRKSIPPERLIKALLRQALYSIRSLVDSEARLARKGKGKPARLSHSAHVLMENRKGLCLDIAVDEANGYAERIQSGAMLDPVRRRHGLWPRTLGADAGYTDGVYLGALGQFGIEPYVPIGDGPIRGVDQGAEARRRARRRRRTKGYLVSQRLRKRVEEIFGWCKTVGGLARCRFVGRWKLKQQGEVAAAA